ncbi:MAG: hypothetical protein QXJ06_00670 [Candidatus Aenigmatarchaeota archaeon]
MKIRACDILGYASNKLIGKVIKFFEEGYREEKSVISHTGLFVNDANCLEEAIIIEALFPKGVVCRYFYDNYKDELENCYILRPLNLKEEDKEKIIDEAFNLVGSGYGVLKLIPQALDGMISKIFRKRNVVLFKKICLIDKMPICSTLVGYVFKKRGYEFGIRYNYANPDDIWDFAIRNRDKYEIIKLLEQGD